MNKRQQKLLGDWFMGIVKFYNSQFQPDFVTLASRYSLSVNEVEDVLNRLNGKSNIGK